MLKGNYCVRKRERDSNRMTFFVFNFPKKQHKKLSNQQNKWFYVNFNIIRKCLYFNYVAFRFLGRNSSSFSVGFLENLRHQKIILRLNNLYKKEIP